MARTILPDGQKPLLNTEQLDLVVTRKTFLRIKDTFYSADTLLIYLCYYYIATIQETDRPHATVEYLRKMTGLGRDKIKRARRALLNMGLIEDITTRGYAKYDVQVNNYTRLVSSRATEIQSGDDISLKTNIRNKDNPVSEDFERFWEVYPRKVNKPDAIKAWRQKEREKKLPPINFILKRLQLTKDTAWADSEIKYIPSPGPWLRGERWGDQLPEENKAPQIPAKVSPEVARKIKEQRKAVLKIAGTFVMHFSQTQPNYKEDVEEDMERMESFAEALIATNGDMSRALPTVEEFAKYCTGLDYWKIPNVKHLTPPDGKLWKEFKKETL